MAGFWSLAVVNHGTSGSSQGPRDLPCFPRVWSAVNPSVPGRSFSYINSRYVHVPYISRITVGIYIYIYIALPPAYTL